MLIFPIYPTYILLSRNVTEDEIRQYFKELDVSVKSIRRVLSAIGDKRFDSYLIELDISDNVTYETSYNIQGLNCYLVKQIVNRHILYLISGKYYTAGYKISSKDNDAEYDKIVLYSP